MDLDRPARRWPILISVSVALLLLVAAAAYAIVERALGDDLSRCERFAMESTARERIVTGHGRRVVVIGDSYAVGLGLDSATDSWPSQVDGEIRVHGFSGSGFSDHVGSCGPVSYAARAPQAVKEGADLVILEGGLNDIDRSDAALRRGVRRVLAVLPDVEVVLVGPASAPARMPGALRVDEVLAREAERAGVDYLSMIEVDLDYLDDGLHLTRDGHREFGEAVASRLDVN